MSENKLVYTTAREKLIKMAKEKGLTNYSIIVKLTQGTSYKKTQEIAKEWCNHLGLSYGAFMKLARNRNW